MVAASWHFGFPLGVKARYVRAGVWHEDTVVPFSMGHVRRTFPGIHAVEKRSDKNTQTLNPKP